MMACVLTEQALFTLLDRGDEAALLAAQGFWELARRDILSKDCGAALEASEGAQPAAVRALLRLARRHVVANRLWLRRNRRATPEKEAMLPPVLALPDAVSYALATTVGGFYQQVALSHSHAEARCAAAAFVRSAAPLNLEKACPDYVVDKGCLVCTAGAVEPLDETRDVAEGAATTADAPDDVRGFGVFVFGCRDCVMYSTIMKRF